MKYRSKRLVIVLEAKGQTDSTNDTQLVTDSSYHYQMLYIHSAEHHSSKIIKINKITTATNANYT